MTEHWYDSLPAVWYTEARWVVICSVLLLMALSFIVGYLLGVKRRR